MIKSSINQCTDLPHHLKERQQDIWSERSYTSHKLYYHHPYWRSCKCRHAYNITITHSLYITQPLSLCKITKAHVDSDSASPKTKRRRSDELSQHRKVVSGNCSQVQISDELMSLEKEKRDEVLKCIRNPITISVLHSLSMKTDLNLPWNILRILQRCTGVAIALYHTVMYVPV